jgi:CHAT domain-containing protein
MPVHAAGVYEGPNQERCSDYVVSSYTPTIAALVQARQGTSTFATRQMRLMTVASETSQDPKMPALPFAMLEIRGVADVAKKAGFSGVLNVTSKADILTALHSSQVVHFACHGIQLTHEPHKSHFCLSNSNLTVLELTQMQLKNPFLAYLSACETAKGDKEHADEAIHLAASMLFAGFKSVVATMWRVSCGGIHHMTKADRIRRAMNDADGPFVAKEFYTRLFQGRDMIDVGLVPYALDDAATALRAKGVPPEQWATFIHMGA